MESSMRWFQKKGLSLALGMVFLPAASSLQAAKKSTEVDFTASQPKPEAPPRVGEATAKKIIAGRPCSSVGGLQKAGAPKSPVEKIGELVTVGKTTAAGKPAAETGKTDGEPQERAQPGGSMTHAEFVERYRSGQLDVRVNKVRVGELVKARSIAVRFRAAHRFWKWLWLLSIPFALACLVWGKWWIALIVLGAGFLLPRVVNRSAYYAFVLERSLEDERFFQDAVEAKALLISART